MRLKTITSNKFLFPLGAAWQHQVDAGPRYGARMLCALNRRFTGIGWNRLSEVARKKLVVIISDAMRYEIADEFGARIRKEDRFEAELDAMLGVLPSYTPTWYGGAFAASDARAFSRWRSGNRRWAPFGWDSEPEQDSRAHRRVRDPGRGCSIHE
jgi:hypothetical protein